MAQRADSGLDAVTLLHRMLEIESRSGQEQQLAAFLVEAFREYGFSRAYVDEAGNAVGEMGDGARTIVLLGHIDTVSGQVPIRQEQGRLYGRGAVDAKGPLAAFITAAANAGILPGARIIVVGAVEEEAATSKGARHIAARFQVEGIPSDCIVGEPSGWDRVTLGYKGRLLADFIAEQPIGHNAGPQGGICEVAVLWWLAVQSCALAFNVGKAAIFDQIQPSLRRLHSSDNGLMEQIEATVGLRIPPGCDVVALRNALSHAASEAGGRVLVYAAEQPYRTDKNNPLARTFVAAIRAEGGTPGFKVKTGTSDMNVIGHAWACPTIAYGPGDSALDHTPEEHIEVEEYLRSISVLTRVLRALVQAQQGP